MTTILGPDSYNGFSAQITDKGSDFAPGAQPIYVGRVTWPGQADPEDTVIKLYEASGCGVANELIGYIFNAAKGIEQPAKGAVLLLKPEMLPPLPIDVTRFIDPDSGLAVCWATSFEGNAKPFRYVRRLSTFDEKQLQAFYGSAFCKKLTGVDHVTGNNDRHEGNFLYIDDLRYLAIDQGNVAGSQTWHVTWPQNTPQNELLRLVHDHLKASQLATWQFDALVQFSQTTTIWGGVMNELSEALKGLLTPDQITTILEYMDERVNDTKFANQCGALFNG